MLSSFLASSTAHLPPVSATGTDWQALDGPDGPGLDSGLLAIARLRTARSEVMAARLLASAGPDGTDPASCDVATDGNCRGN